MSVSRPVFSADRPRLLGALRWLSRDINGLLVVAALLFALYALTAGPYHLRLLSVAGTYVLMVIGYQFIFGYAGAVSLAQSCFFGFGAYVAGILEVHYGYTATVTLPLAIVGSGCLAALAALLVLRLQDHYFSMVTLTLTLLLQLIAIQWRSFTGGNNGLPGVPSIQLFSWHVNGRYETMVLVWALVIIAGLLALQIRRGLYGRSFHLMRENLQVAASLGVDVDRLRFSAFVASACYAGLGGALLAHILHVVSPEMLGLPLMITCVTMTVIGGQYRIAGAVMGAILIVYFKARFRGLENYMLVAYGTVALCFLIIAPYGLVGAIGALRRRYLPVPRSSDESDVGIDLQSMPHAPPPETVNGPLVAINSVTKSFGAVRALADVSFEVRAGEIVGLIGANGSGKTTLINIMSGLYRAEAGTVTFRGHEVNRLAAFEIGRLGMARTFQHIHLVDDLSVIDNIALGCAGREGASLWGALCALGRDHGLHRARRRARRSATILGIAEYSDMPCGQLAYGLRRRVEIARALATQPYLLLLDEPAAGFNEEEQRDLARRIQRIAQTGIAVLVVEHNLHFLSAIAERLICLDHGEMIAAGAPEAVRTDSRVIESYLGSAI